MHILQNKRVLRFILNFSRMRGRSGVTGDTMAEDSTLVLSLVEEFVSGLQDSKAKDAAKGKSVFISSCSTHV